MIIRAIYLLFIVTCLVGCATISHVTSGINFDESKRVEIIKNVSTKEDILKLYGEPLEKMLNEESNEQWMYYYSQTDNEYNLWKETLVGTSRIKKLTIVFHDTGVVKTFVFSESTVPILSQPGAAKKK